MDRARGAWAPRLLLAAAPLAAAAAVGLLQRRLWRGVETGAIELALVALALPLLDLVARALGAGRRPWAGHPLAVLAACLAPLDAALVYPLRRIWPAFVLGWALLALHRDLPSARERALAPGPERDLLARRRRVFRTVVALVWGGVLALGCELALRKKGSYESWLERNGSPYVCPLQWTTRTPWVLVLEPGSRAIQEQPEFRFELAANSEGLRDREHPVRKPEGEWRLALLGDSFVMGQGAAFEDTIGEQLQASLRARSLDKTCTVLEGGVAASDPVFEYQLLARRLAKYSPDACVVCVNGSDVDDVVSRGGLDRFEPDGRLRDRPLPWFLPLFARSHLVRALVTDGLGFDDCFTGPIERPARKLAAAREISAALAEIRKLVPATVVVLHPFRYQIQDATAPDDLVYVRRVLEEERAPFVDLLPDFREAVAHGASLDDLFWAKDQHCKKAGYALMARAIERELLKLPSFPRAR